MLINVERNKRAKLLRLRMIDEKLSEMRTRNTEKMVVLIR